MDTNIRPAEQDGEWDESKGGRRTGYGVRREVNKSPYRHFGVTGHLAPGVATRHLPCQGDVHGAIAAVSGHGPPTGAFQKCHSPNHDVTGLAKCPPEKQTSYHWTVEALCMVMS